MNVQIEDSWKEILKDEFEKDYFQALMTKVDEAYRTTEVFPSQDHIFNAFNHCYFDDVKVVIIGQDPYHNDGQAHGLSFSVPEGVKIPPSLRNIYKEIQSDLGKSIPESGNLEHWAKQGVLLLNATLTVQAHEAGSHQGIGWEEFTDAAIHHLAHKRKHIVFMLWGAYAQKKGQNVDSAHHLTLEAPHPSPLSAHRGFLGCKHFSKCNEYLKQNNLKEIDW